jgi:hypothetical protein
LPGVRRRLLSALLGVPDQIRLWRLILFIATLRRGKLAAGAFILRCGRPHPIIFWGCYGSCTYEAHGPGEALSSGLLSNGHCAQWLAALYDLRGDRSKGQLRENIRVQAEKWGRPRRSTLPAQEVVALCTPDCLRAPAVAPYVLRVLRSMITLTRHEDFSRSWRHGTMGRVPHRWKPAVDMGHDVEGRFSSGPAVGEFYGMSTQGRIEQARNDRTLEPGRGV